MLNDERKSCLEKCHIPLLGGVYIMEPEFIFWVTLMNVTADKLNSKVTQNSSEFETVFENHWSRVYNVIFRLVGDPDEAQDLALETFWQYYQSNPASRENLSGWLYRVAVNKGLNALRARKRRSHYEREAGSREIDEQQSSEPEQETILSEEREVVREVLDQMNPRSAKLLVLRYSGLAYAELADALHVNPASVGKMLARAQDEFQLLYNQVEGG
jgi:RNA polymerase sigma-70 factor (ECF subfamily)